MNTYYRTMKRKPFDVNDNKYIESSKEVINKGPTFQVGDHVRVSKNKDSFANRNTPNWSQEVFVI